MRKIKTKDDYLKIYDNSGYNSLKDFQNQLEELHKLMEDLCFDCWDFYDLCDLMDFVYDDLDGS